MKDNSKHGNRYCLECHGKLVKNGKECGKQRWRCRSCGSCKIRPRKDVSIRNRQSAIANYLTKTTTATDIAKKQRKSRTTFWRERQSFTSNCDHGSSDLSSTHSLVIRPYGGIIIIDAKHLRPDVVAIVRDPKYVRYWVYGGQENSLLWDVALKPLSISRSNCN